MTVSKKHGRRLSMEEEELWRLVMRDVHQLARHRKASRVVQEKRITERDDKPSLPFAPEPVQKRAPVPSAQTAPETAIAPLRLGQTTGLDKRTSKRLDHGRLPIEARLDLHGMVQSAAHSALTYFIMKAHADGKRCVLVITGKGERYRHNDTGDMHERGGVLRRSVPQWLNEAGLRTRILKFTYAQPKDGGEGALYILLRRKR